MIVEHSNNNSNYNRIVQIINQLEYFEQLKLLEDIKGIIASSKKKKKPNYSWIGSLSKQTKILGDIAGPVMTEDEWEVLSS